jgi:hypothetical protein
MILNSFLLLVVPLKVEALALIEAVVILEVGAGKVMVGVEVLDCVLIVA